MLGATPSRHRPQTNSCKFSQNPDLQRALAATGDKHITEASPYDLIWGIGYRAEHPYAGDKTRWRERNLLGRKLMDVREGLGSNLPRLLCPRPSLPTSLCSPEPTHTPHRLDPGLPYRQRHPRDKPLLPLGNRQIPHLGLFCHPPTQRPCPAATAIRSMASAPRLNHTHLPPRRRYQIRRRYQNRDHALQGIEDLVDAGDGKLSKGADGV